MLLWFLNKIPPHLLYCWGTGVPKLCGAWRQVWGVGRLLVRTIITNLRPATHIQVSGKPDRWTFSAVPVRCTWYLLSTHTIRYTWQVRLKRSAYQVYLIVSGWPKSDSVRPISTISAREGVGENRNSAPLGGEFHFTTRWRSAKFGNP
jgi:hypothetical protein